MVLWSMPGIKIHRLAVPDFPVNSIGDCIPVPTTGRGHNARITEPVDFAISSAVVERTGTVSVGSKRGPI